MTRTAITNRFLFVIVVWFFVSAGVVSALEREGPESPAVGDSLNVRRVGRGLFEPFEEIDCEGGDCYIYSRGDVVVLDASDLGEMRVRGYGSLGDDSRVSDLCVEGDYVYVTKRRGVLWVMRMVSEDELEVVGSYSSGDYMSVVEVSGGLAYVGRDTSLVILDVSDPGSIEEVGEYMFYTTVSDLFLSDTLCYAACGDTGLVILDVSDPTDPEKLGSYVTGDWALGVAVRGDTAYVARSIVMDVLDVSDPGSIELLGTCNEQLGGFDVQLVNHYAVVRGAFVVSVVDVADPGHMEVVYEENWSSLYDIYTDSSNLYIVCLDGLRVLDLSRDVPPAPLVGSYGGNHFPRDIEVQGSYAYIADWLDDHFRVLDVSDRHFPKLVGSYEMKYPYGIDINYPYAYVTSFEVTYQPLDGFLILDVSDPDSIVRVGHYDVDAWGVCVRWPYAYLAVDDNEHDPDRGLVILDISSPDSIFEVSSFGVAMTAHGIAVRDSVVYMAGAFYGVYLIDVSDPTEPELLSTTPECGDIVWNLFVGGDYLYAAADYCGVRVYNISDLLNPYQVDSYIGAYGKDVFLKDPYLYVGGGGRGVKVLDVSEPDSLREVGYYDLPNVYEVFTHNGYIYTGTSTYGFYTFEFTPTGINDDGEGRVDMPASFGLSQNYPNPMNPTTTVRYEVPGAFGERKRVLLAVYDVRGRLVKTLVDGRVEAGAHSVVWDGRDGGGTRVASGVYLYTLKTGSSTLTRKLVVLE